MSAILNVAFPVFGIILAGYLCAEWRLLGAESSVALNRFVYWIAFPPYLFLSMARVPIHDTLRPDFLAAFGGGTVIAFVLARLCSGRFGTARPAAHSLRSFVASFPNTGYIGIPLFLAAFGPAETQPAIIATVFNAAVALGIVVVLVELDLTPSAGVPAMTRDVAMALVRNPLVTAPVLGLLASAVGLTVPTPIARFCELLGAAASPCALVALGLFLSGRPLTRYLPTIGWITVLKMLVQPALTWAIAVPLLHMEPRWSSAAVLLAALPTGTLAFTVAQAYQLDVESTAAATLATTLVSVITIPLLLTLLQFG
ncbi:MAG TPA: AEC family transporter [Stellaceae bacterium]|nr:AEC family transporter [Stellaceae bacterium]